jgi:hypothetical protein
MITQVTLDDLISFSALASRSEGQTEERTKSKAEGMDRAERNADPLWKAAALQVVHDICSECPTFTADDVLERLESLEVETHDNRALGAVMRSCARLGLCQLTDRVQPSRIKIRHCRPVAVWRSLIGPLV